MRLTLLERKNETSDVESFIFKPAESVNWKPGQFFHYALYHRPTDDRGSDRFFTNAAAPFEEQIMITTRFTLEKGSTFKNKLKEFKQGDEIEVADLDGDFVLESTEEDYVFIAGGIGITPFRAILKQLFHEGKHIPVTLLYSNRDQNIVYKDELEEIAKANSSFTIHYVFSPERIDEKKIREFVPDLRKPIFYVSGPEPMVENLGTVLKNIGVAEDHIKQDWFPGYLEV